MDNVYDFSDPRAVKQEAFDWLIRLDGDEALTDDESRALREWLARSPAHRDMLLKLNKFWGNNVLTELMVPLGKPESQDQPLDKRGHWMAPWRYAAIAALVGVTLGFLTIWNAWDARDLSSDSNGLYVTAVGQQSSSLLADGTVVYLNTNSQIDVDFDSHYRNIRLLQGEVHFEVAKNPERPFRVYAGDGRVEAVGTAFTMYLKTRDLDVLVTEGRVAVASLDRALADTKLAEGSASGVDPYVGGRAIPLAVVEAGHSVSIKTPGNTSVAQAEHNDIEKVVTTVSEDELDRRQSWRNGYLSFAGESLAEVVEEISRFTTVSIEIENAALGDIQIGGLVKLGEIDEMLDALETNFSLQVTRLSYNRVQLSAAPDP